MTVQQHKRLPHIGGDLFQLIAFLPERLHLGRDFQMLLLDAVQQRRQLFVCIVLHGMLQIQLIDGLHKPSGHPGCQKCGQRDCQHDDNAHRLHHARQQHPKGFLAGGNAQHAAVGQARCLVNALFQQRVGMAHGTAAAISQRLLDLFALQMVFHPGGLGVGIEFHGAIRLNPGNPIVASVQRFQKVQSRLLRSGSGDAQLVPQLHGLQVIGVPEEHTHHKQQAAAQHRHGHRDNGLENFTGHPSPPNDIQRRGWFRYAVHSPPASAAACECAYPPSGSLPRNPYSRPPAAADPG